MFAWLLLAGLPLLAPGLAQAARPPLVVPDDDAALVARLPRGYASLEPEAAAAEPGSGDRLARARALLQAAAETGDARLATRADALLDGYPADSRDPSVMRLRAFSAQHRHDFAAAIRLLDALVAADPRTTNDRVSRAQVELVQGRLGRARRDCRALALGLDVEDGLLCAASLSLRKGELQTAASLLDRLLADLPATDPRRAFCLLERAETAARAADPGADAWFQKAMAAAPGDVRPRVAYARHLRRSGRPQAVEALLRDMTQSDTAQLQRTLAARAAGRSNAAALEASQARRYALAHALGSQPELRDEAEFLLRVRRRPEAALALALRNFERQRDVEDVDILVRAARAARRPRALEGLRAWAQEEAVPLPRAAGA